MNSMKSPVESIQTAALKILIVEDYVTDLKLMHSILARAGHDVTVATSAEQAIKI